MIADAIHNRFAEETYRSISIFHGLQGRGGSGNFVQQRLDTALRRACFAKSLELFVKDIELIKGGEEFQTPSLMQIRRVGRRRCLAVARRPAGAVEASAQARINK